MTSEHTPAHDDHRDSEMLVAYLDGEVADEERHAIEQRLAEDAALRDQLVGLQKTWQMLDRLPTAHVDDSFTRSTITMAVQSARKDPVDDARSPWRHAKTLAAIAAMIALGYVAVSVPWRTRARKKLEDLPVANNLDLYRYADNVEFLRQLDASQLFDEESNDVL